MNDKAGKPVYQRVLLKLSGEALMGGLDYGIDPDILTRIAGDMKTIVRSGVQLAVVVGGGNIFRGAGLAAAGMDRVSGDNMGMLATVINALALQDALEQMGVYVRVMSAIKINEICEDYIRRRAIRHLEKGRVIVCAAGTGNPFFTTDSAASLRAAEIGADVVLKATKVDGVYSADPLEDSSAEYFSELTYDQVIERKLKVMDTSAIVMCRERGIPLRIFNLNQEGALLGVVRGEAIGTLIH